jgi:hypothetical protein
MPGFVHFLKNILGFDPDPSNAAIRDAIEIVVDNSSSKIRLIGGYKKKLRHPVETALGHIERLIETIPGPMDVTARSNVDDLLAKAFFMNGQELQTAVADNPDLNDFFAREKEQTFFVLLTMDRDVNTYFGSELQGALLFRDVALRSVGFSNHKFRVPSLAMGEAVQALKFGALQILAHQALEIILEEQSRKEGLKDLKDELTARVGMMGRERQQMILGWKDPSGMQTYKEAQELLDTVEEELRVIKTEQLDLDYYLNRVEHVLNHPDKYLAGEQVTMHFDRMGILIEGEPDRSDDEVRVLDVKFNFNERRSAVFLKCDRDTLMNV